MNDAFPDLDALLHHLRQEGLVVGARERRRLRHAFALGAGGTAEHPAQATLRALLAAALVHSPQERAVFDRVYTLWQERLDAWCQSGQARRGADTPRGTDTAAAPLSWWQRLRASWRGLRSRLRGHEPRTAALLLAGLGATAILAAMLWLLLQPPPLPVTGKPVPVSLPVSMPTVPDGLELVTPPRRETFTTWKPVFRVEATGPASTLPLAVIGLALWLVALALGWRYRQRAAAPKAVESGDQAGPRRQPLLPLPADAAKVLDAAAGRTLVWGVDRYRSEDLTGELDLDASVAATARAAGLPHLEYRRDTRLREVWLWLDGSLDDPAAGRWCEEVAVHLRAAGAPARFAAFDGYPDELRWEQGQRFSPLEVEGWRQTAQVAVCTDGALLLRHLSGFRHARLHDLLRALGAWPHLVFVDYSHHGALRRTLADYAIPCLPADAVPGFFGPGAPPPVLNESIDLAQLRLWAAALALATRPVEPTAAFALRRHLRLHIPARTLARLSQADTPLRDLGPARLQGTGLEWSTEQRRALLNWLHRAEGTQDHGLAPGSRLARALGFWQRRLADEAKARERRSELEPWEQRPPARYLRMERALLDLWRDPRRAAEALYPLHDDPDRAGPLRQTIRRACGELAPADCAGEGHIRLPWRLADLGDDRAAWLLGQMGLGGVVLGALRRPGRLGLGLGLLAGLGAGLLAVALYSGGPRAARQIVVEGKTPPPAAHVYRKETEGRVYAGSPYTLESATAGDGDRVHLTWRPTELACSEALGESLLLRCGAAPSTIREAMDRPHRVLAVLAYPRDDPGAEHLAAALLDGGSADAVLLGDDAGRQLPALLAPDRFPPDGQLLLIHPPSAPLSAPTDSGIPRVRLESAAPADMAARLEGLSKPAGVARVWGPLLRGGDGTAIQLGYCPRRTARHPASGVEFVWVCGGEFQMGSAEDDSEADSDERPAHPVRLSGFWIGRHEVSYRQYRAAGGKPFRSAPPEDNPDMPLNTVSWDEARAWCRGLGSGFDLPTEAEWEYAARGHGGRKYPWGEESPTPELARFDQSIGSSPLPIGGREAGAGPFGTLDQAGNLWEWVADWYGPYEAGEIVDNPVGPPKGVFRILRGGALWDRPGNLRSAFRGWNLPLIRYDVRGFRCVRRQLDPSAHRPLVP